MTAVDVGMGHAAEDSEVVPMGLQELEIGERA